MPKQLALQNNFLGGLKTEFTGLNFPENAATAVDNCVFTLLGDVLRRNGINFEVGYFLNGINTSNVAISTYRWKNAGGDGETEILVLQVGATLYFFQSSISSISQPLSCTELNSTVTISNYTASGGYFDTSVECQFSDGNGYLFVYNKNCDPFYCTFSSETVSSNLISLQIRDFNGIPDGLPVSYRPPTLSPEHQYNLFNQGWSNSPAASWTATASPDPILVSINLIGTDVPFTVGTDVSGITGGETVQCFGYFSTGRGTEAFSLMQGTVVSYIGNTLTIAIVAVNLAPFAGVPTTVGTWVIQPYNLSTGYINTWFSDIGNYPSNSDIWWTFKDSTGAFNPNSTESNTEVLTSGQAPQGHYIINPFNQTPGFTSNISGLNNITTAIRPSNGAWYAGRVWYTGVNAAQSTLGDQPYYTWTENIYFSQIITPGDVSSFGNCYQVNDPTADATTGLFDLLPDDGGVITIQGCGNVFKLFPVQNGMLVFASNGIWFITGSSGIGFTANDYTITKISNVQSISPHSFINVLGYPIFWNEEGIYTVEPSQQQGFMVNPITLGTILTFYNSIPTSSKIYARGDYNPITYVLEWVYRSTSEAGISNRYQFDSALCLNIKNQAFYPYSISSNGACTVNGLVYMNYPPGAVAASIQPNPGFKYLTTINSNLFTFAEENDNTDFIDWFSYDNIGVNYESYFETGYSLAGKGVTKWQPIYVQMFTRVPTTYTIQGVWDYAVSGDSGRWSSVQLVNNIDTNYGQMYRRHKIRGHGESLQLVVSSVDGQPFDIIGWTVLQQVDMGV